ncbi:MAG TPA: aldehyde dehydrogenase [Flavobacterium sp.]|jgi:aldehyde dehydrogenase (NAD+)|nr:aldehyde dehydrogenase [Flavobacterium sp.]
MNEIDQSLLSLEYKRRVLYRTDMLKKLLHHILIHEDGISQALYDDFKKPEFESVLTEISIVVSELRYTIRNLESWGRPKLVFPSLLNFPSTDYIYSEPYGDVLIIAPWNYPFQLAMIPLIAAIAGGNTVTLKPSELTPRTSNAIGKIVSFACDSYCVKVVEGGPEVTTELLKKRWDYIFFTGSVAVGKIIAKAAAEHLTPVTLELGGKNPCIVHDTANIPLAAKRIVWGKFINAGQTCIAPDYLVVHKKVKAELITALKKELLLAYGNDPKQSPDYARIINKKNWDRLNDMIDHEDIIHGGVTDEETLYIAPTLIEENTLDSKVMDGEIFGPLLPIVAYVNDEDLDYIVRKHLRPLALYLFTSDMKFATRTMRKYAFGGGCINDTVVHFGNRNLPFGGIGESGLGAYHGKRSYDLFTHKKSIVRKATWLDIPFRYAPYGNKVALLRQWIKWF